MRNYKLVATPNNNWITIYTKGLSNARKMEKLLTENNISFERERYNLSLISKCEVFCGNIGQELIHKLYRKSLEINL